ncbi:MAG TPA: hypothetical protein VN317_04675 [Candidatus Methanoperedens sp.]|nr:hypothetical protein [Candidatus Methanoperedens sp.]
MSPRAGCAFLALAGLLAAVSPAHAAGAPATEAVWKDGADFTRPRKGVDGQPALVAVEASPGVPGIRLVRRAEPLVPLGGEALLWHGEGKLRFVDLAPAASAARTLAAWSVAGQVRSALLDLGGRLPATAAAQLGSPDMAKNNVAVAWSSRDSRWLVAWAERRDLGVEIRAQVIDARGKPSGPEIPVARGASLHNPAVACSATSGACLVVWQEAEGREWSIRARRLGGAGPAKDPARNAAKGATAKGAAKGAAADSPPFTVCGVPGVQYNPAVAWSPEEDTFLVVWDDKRGGTADVFAQALDADGRPRGPERNLTATPARGELSPAVAWLTAARRFLVTWDDDRGGEIGIWGRTLGLAGEAGPEIAISTGPRNRLQSRIAADERNGRWVVAWQDGRNSYNYWQVRLRPVDAQGVPGEELAVTDRTLAAYNPEIVWDPGAGWFIVAWSHLLGERSELLLRAVGGDYVPTGSVAGLRVDGGAIAPRWREVQWDGRLPEGTEVLIRARAAASAEELGAAPWSAFSPANPLPLDVPRLRWLELELRLGTGAPAATPEIDRLVVRYAAR